MKMPKRLFACTALVVTLAVSATATLPVAAQETKSTEFAGSLDIWDLVRTAWANLILGSETLPSDPDDDTPAPPPPSDDRCSDSEDCDPATEQVPFGDPNG